LGGVGGTKDDQGSEVVYLYHRVVEGESCGYKKTKLVGFVKS